MTGGLDIERILQMLPHRWPFVLVDRVGEIVPGERIRGHKAVGMNEPWFAGHFPKRPVMPGVLILEALAQIGGVLAAVGDGDGNSAEAFDPEKNVVYFLGVDKAKFRRPVIPGDRLDLDVSVIHRRGNVWKLRGEAAVDGERAAEGELLTSIVPRSS
jgi:3-hydroxyacyl-[acyl-carrier-protein] dehydratase